MTFVFLIVCMEKKIIILRKKAVFVNDSIFDGVSSVARFLICSLLKLTSCTVYSAIQMENDKFVMDYVICSLLPGCIFYHRKCTKVYTYYKKFWLKVTAFSHWFEMNTVWERVQQLLFFGKTKSLWFFIPCDFPASLTTAPLTYPFL